VGVITGTTKLLGVIGHPVEHSLSPVIHNAALARLHSEDSQPANYVYLAFPVKPSALRAAIDGFTAIDLWGFNVTLPHKQAILPLLTEVSAIAQVVGAVNTVWRTDEGWSGTNTDVEGFLAPLQGQRDWTETTVVILGSGGAARAVVAGCAQLNCAAIRVVGRDHQRLKQFRHSWHQADLGEALSSGMAIPRKTPPANLQVHLWEELPDLLPQANLLVNTTPVGMQPRIEQSPLSAAAVAQLPPGAIVYDLIYTPRPTLLLKQAQSQGLIVIDGLEMLIQQGAAALRIWLQKPVPVDVMRQAAQQHLALYSG